MAITEHSRHRLLTALAAGLALVLLVIELPFYLASGLMAPLWAVATLVVIWAVLFGLGCYAATRRSYWVLVLPVLAIGIWFAAMYLGEGLLGWQA